MNDFAINLKPAKKAKKKNKAGPPPRIARWLFICAASVFLMALIGAITRLTESGLSIVEWKPITGALPPMNPPEWAHEFDLYKKSPQFLKMNSGMTLPEFKHIFFWEWLHRLWGRVIVGIIYAVPLCWYWVQGKIPAAAKPAFLFILGLGFAQGLMGWLMVKSGLNDQPAVSHYLLAAHLMLAFLIYASMFRLGLSFGVKPERDAGKMTSLRAFIQLTLLLAVVTMTWGAFVAGLRAGLLYNDTFPMMGQYPWPMEGFQVQPPWLAFFAEPATVQFTHRVLAITTFCAMLTLAVRARHFHPPQRLRRLFTALAVMAFVQVGLGISTLVSHVNIILATAHQAGALTVLTLLVWLLHEIPHIRQEK
jgi:cytochrome c oxidase assembly protein subunit 15